MKSEVRKQFELLPTGGPKPHTAPVTPELIQFVRTRATLLDAWNLAQDFSTLQDKTIYDVLGIDSSWWTKIGKGTASPPADERFVRYMDIVQNEFPLIWLAEARGYDWTTIRKHRDDKDRRIAELEQKLAAKEQEVQAIVNFHKATR